MLLLFIWKWKVNKLKIIVNVLIDCMDSRFGNIVKVTKKRIEMCNESAWLTSER